MEREQKSGSRKHFDRICALWKVYETSPFVSRQRLHEELWRGLADYDDPVTIYLVPGGIDLALEAFAKSGPDWRMFNNVMNEIREPDQYFRYPVTRAGVEGYARADALTESERYEIVAALRRAGDEAIREADAMDRETARLNRNFKVV